MLRKISIGIFLIALIFLLLLVWRKATMTMNTIRYVSLGDSYSNGEGETQQDAWPVLLTNHLQQAGYPIELIVNPAASGWTTTDLIEGQLPVFIAAKPTFATLLIGANDIARGNANPDAFHTNLIKILDTMQAHMPDKKNIVLVTIPDFAVTPQGRMYLDGENGVKEIEAFNTIIKEEGKNRGLPVVDIFDLTKAMGTDSSLVTADGLHPSAKELKLWEVKIYPVVGSLFKDN